MNICIGGTAMSSVDNDVVDDAVIKDEVTLD